MKASELLVEPHSDLPPPAYSRIDACELTQRIKQLCVSEALRIPCLSSQFQQTRQMVWGLTKNQRKRGASFITRRVEGGVGLWRTS